MSIKEEELDLRIEPSFTERYLGLSTRLFLFLTLIVILAGIYIGVILYGTNSIDILLDLQAYESYLSDEIERLKQKNAQLQKEYFELKEISGMSQKR